MPRSIKANLPWVDAVGSITAGGLTERYARPMIYRQSGPYNQVKNPHVGIFFNDPILHHVASVNRSHTVDFRFGFCIERSFSPEVDDYQILAGFEILNPTLSLRFFMPNVRAEHLAVAAKLTAWLRRPRTNVGFVYFNLSDDEKYVADNEEGQDELAEALEVYSSPGRKVSSLTWRRTRFTAIVHLPKYNGWSESELINGHGDLAAETLASFKRLDFLYSMLFPRDLGPSRMSGGQNRALRTKQPDRRCSWVTADQCKGTVDAAHIKPDRLGGHAVPSNLFWLCKFHHKLLDYYLKASLTLDRRTRRIIASISTVPPSRSKADGIPLVIWEAIEDKRAWPLPLSSNSIDHLFD